MGRLFLLTLAFLIPILGGCRLVTLIQPETLPAPRVQKYTLPNGLTLTVESSDAVPLVTLDMWVRVGSGDEPSEIAGISHFLEHMLFKGTERLPVGEYDRRIEAIGGYLNAATSMDYTHYFVTFPAEHFERVLTDFADVLRNSLIDPEEVERERQVILEEIRRKMDNPLGFLFDETMPSVHAQGPYTHPVIGFTNTVEAITREQLLEHYHRFYAPSNMFLAISGNVGAINALRAVEAVFDDFDRPFHPWREEPPASVSADPKTRMLPRDWKEAYFIMAFPAPSRTTAREMAVAELAETLMAGGRTARLVHSLRERQQLVSSIGAYFATNRHESAILIYGACEPSRLDEVREAILAEIDLLRAEGMRSDEARRIRRQVRNSTVFSRESTTGRASGIGFSKVMTGTPEIYVDYLRELERVRDREVLDYIKSTLLRDRAHWFTSFNPNPSPAAR